MKDYKNFSERLEDFHVIVNELKSFHSFHDIGFVQPIIVETNSPYVAYMRPMSGIDSPHSSALLEIEGKVVLLLCIDDGSVSGIFAARGQNEERILFTCVNDIIAFTDTLKKGIWR